MNHKEVTDIFMIEVNKARDEEGNNGYHLIHVLSAMLEYEEHLVHLDTLIVSLQSYHHDDHDVDIPERDNDSLKNQYAWDFPIAYWFFSWSLALILLPLLIQLLNLE